MKHIIIILLFGLLAAGCTKQTPALPVGNIVSLQISGFTVDDSLQLIHGDKVFATVANSFNINTLLSIAPDQMDQIYIRKKGAAATIATRNIPATPFMQTTSIFYDNGKIYDKTITLLFKGYAMVDSLELTLDDQVVSSGIESNFTPSVAIGAEEGMARVLQIKNKKTGAVLSTRKITATPAKQNITFFYDGKELIDKLDLTPPVNPTHMNVSAKFETTLPGLFTGTPIDLTFYKYDVKKGVTAAEETGIKLSVSGTFSEPLALPSLPEDYRYFFRLAQTGINTLPYDTTKELLPIRNVGSSNLAITFVPGTAQLWVIKDQKIKIANGPMKGTQFRLLFTDLSQYFQ